MFENYEARRCIVYRADHEPDISVLATPPPHPLPHAPTIADHVLVRDVMSRDLICVRAEVDAAPILDLMVRHRIGCVPVVDARRVAIGVITKYDVLEHVRRQRQTHLRSRASEVMMPYATTVHESQTLAFAVGVMMGEDIHHVLVVDDNHVVVGVLSSNDVVAWLVMNDSITLHASTSPDSPWRAWDTQ